ncbi:MAG: hypothetical protein COV99_05520, partial [Bacteroidetes bacterium CG12_big_fil_rev_8_21_14_0_65_60_17]
MALFKRLITQSEARSCNLIVDVEPIYLVHLGFDRSMFFREDIQQFLFFDNGLLCSAQEVRVESLILCK